MKKNPIKWYFFIFVFFIISCSGTKLTQKQVNEEFKGKPVSDILVIAIADKEKSRLSFEKKFVAHLKAVGVEAVSSADVIPMPADLELQKEDILNAVKKFKNDAVIITHVKSIEDKDIYTRNYRGGRGYYGYYGYAHSYVHNPGYSSIDTIVRLETNLYDVKTEQLIWSGQSKTWNKDSKNEIINDVIKVVINDLQKNKLIKKK
ncbi:MAG: hypothetical protein HF978_14000 [Desulfobacteraceae bacterium]|nr:hypothetical protein [Desulfobacteraceae bacterium]MBC2756652.1 hypothetical protein [Desulfobacteraceae bacterium]